MAAEAVAVRSRPQREIYKPLHPATRSDRREQLRRVAAVRPTGGVGTRSPGNLEGDQIVHLFRRRLRHVVHHGGGDGCQRQEHLPLVTLAGFKREDRRRPAGGVAHGQGGEDDVVVTPGQRRGRGQDHIGVPGSLGHVRVQADQEVEIGKRALEPGRVGCGHDRVAGDCDQCTQALAAVRIRGVDLLGQRRHRELPEHARQTPHPRALTAGHPDAPTPARFAEGGRPARRGQREHHPARPVEVAGEHVDDGDQP